MKPDETVRFPGPRLFALTFAALFLELLLIRWAPSVVRLVAYYANLLLISSFLGLGLGLMLQKHGSRLFLRFPWFLLFNISILLVCRQSTLPKSSQEMRFYEGGNSLFNIVILLLIFTSNTAVFVPLGERIGTLFSKLPTLSAYAWDLGGGLCGTVLFGFFSYLCFSPTLGLAIGILGFVLVAWRKIGFSGILLLLACLGLVSWSEDPEAIWSPYYHVTVSEQGTGRKGVYPPPNLKTMRSPPSYVVRVNQDVYQFHGTLKASRHPDPWSERVQWSRLPYLLPYAVAQGRERVCVVGSGGGADAEAALLSGALQVDAVDIDPTLIGLSLQLNASGVYEDPRVTVYNEDARAFLERAAPGYALLVFGLLDSQGLFSAMANVRLDGFTYTVESLRAAYSLLETNGVLCVSFGVGDQEWLAAKLYQMLSEATGQEPLMYRWQWQVIYCVPKGKHSRPPQFGRFKLTLPEHSQALDSATDDWPYLYLRKRTIPSDYAVVIGFLSVMSVALVGSLRRATWGTNDSHFALLGFGFLLVETKAVTDCSLYFGSTWLVTMLVVTGVLLMALLANVVASGLKFTRLMYVPLLVTVCLLYWTPQAQILALPWSWRVLWAILAVPLPVFFGGLIFSSTLRDSASPATLLGANLVGAMFGGFCEYLAMATGASFLSLLVACAYLGSLGCRVLLERDR